MIYLYQLTTEWLLHFARILFSQYFAYAKFRENKTLTTFSRNFAYAKFRENKTLTKNSKFTVWPSVNASHDDNKSMKIYQTCNEFCQNTVKGFPTPQNTQTRTKISTSCHNDQYSKTCLRWTKIWFPRPIIA